MIAKVCDRESRQDSWFENRLVTLNTQCPYEEEQGWHNEYVREYFKALEDFIVNKKTTQINVVFLNAIVSCLW